MVPDRTVLAGQLSMAAFIFMYQPTSMKTKMAGADMITVLTIICSCSLIVVVVSDLPAALRASFEEYGKPID